MWVDGIATKVNHVGWPHPLVDGVAVCVFGTPPFTSAHTAEENMHACSRRAIKTALACLSALWMESLGLGMYVRWVRPFPEFTGDVS